MLLQVSELLLTAFWCEFCIGFGFRGWIAVEGLGSGFRVTRCGLSKIVLDHAQPETRDAARTIHPNP